MKKTTRRLALAASVVLAASTAVGVSASHAADVELKMIAADYPGDGKT